jgi:hypothetical protein
MTSAEMLQRTYLRFIEEEATAKRARGTDSPRRIVDGEEYWKVGIKKRGVIPPHVRSTEI